MRDCAAGISFWREKKESERKIGIVTYAFEKLQSERSGLRQSID